MRARVCPLLDVRVDERADGPLRLHQVNVCSSQALAPGLVARQQDGLFEKHFTYEWPSAHAMTAQVGRGGG